MTQDDEWTDWIEHDGGECPVPGDEEVVVKLASGSVNWPEIASEYVWTHRAHRFPYMPVIHYKRRKSAVEEDAPSTSALSEQIGGDHYKKLGAYQPWEVLRRWLTPEEFRGYMKGTAIAYLARERDKGKDKDITKAGHTLRLWDELK